MNQFEYQQEVGDRLKAVRKRHGWSLQNVERLSLGEIKMSVLGAYERGERSTTIWRLKQLAEFYDVDITELIPHDGVNNIEIAYRVNALHEAVEALAVEIAGRP